MKDIRKSGRSKHGRIKGAGVCRAPKCGKRFAWVESKGGRVQAIDFHDVPHSLDCGDPEWVINYLKQRDAQPVPAHASHVPAVREAALATTQEGIDPYLYDFATPDFIEHASPAELLQAIQWFASLALPDLRASALAPVLRAGHAVHQRLTHLVAAGAAPRLLEEAPEPRVRQALERCTGSLCGGLWTLARSRPVLCRGCQE